MVGIPKRTPIERLFLQRIQTEMGLAYKPASFGKLGNHSLVVLLLGIVIRSLSQIVKKRQGDMEDG